jgi:hypothetical protein
MLLKQSQIYETIATDYKDFNISFMNLYSQIKERLTEKESKLCEGVAVKLMSIEIVLNRIVHALQSQQYPRVGELIQSLDQLLSEVIGDVTRALGIIVSTL